MTHVEMLESHPQGLAGVDKDVLAECIAACFECAQTCTMCADACLGEEMVAELTACIRTDLDCADICAATGNVVARRTSSDTTILRAALEACATACKACGDECEKHGAHMQHCKECAEACRAGLSTAA